MQQSAVSPWRVLQPFQNCDCARGRTLVLLRPECLPRCCKYASLEIASRGGAAVIAPSALPGDRPDAEMEGVGACQENADVARLHEDQPAAEARDQVDGGGQTAAASFAARTTRRRGSISPRTHPGTCPGR